MKGPPVFHLRDPNSTTAPKGMAIHGGSADDVFAAWEMRSPCDSLSRPIFFPVAFRHRVSALPNTRPSLLLEGRCLRSIQEYISCVLPDVIQCPDGRGSRFDHCYCRHWFYFDLSQYFAWLRICWVWVCSLSAVRMRPFDMYAYASPEKGQASSETLYS